MGKKLKDDRIYGWICVLHSEKIVGHEMEAGNTAREALKKLKVSPKEIAKLIAEYEALDPAAERARLQKVVDDYSQRPISKGYTDGPQVYVLECSHQIRSSKVMGLFGKGLLGKMVLCEICGANRKVASAPYWVR